MSKAPTKGRKDIPSYFGTPKAAPAKDEKPTSDSAAPPVKPKSDQKNAPKQKQKNETLTEDDKRPASGTVENLPKVPAADVPLKNNDQKDGDSQLPLSDFSTSLDKNILFHVRNINGFNGTWAKLGTDGMIALFIRKEKVIRWKRTKGIPHGQLSDCSSEEQKLVMNVQTAFDQLSLPIEAVLDLEALNIKEESSKDQLNQPSEHVSGSRPWRNRQLDDNSSQRSKSKQSFRSERQSFNNPRPGQYHARTFEPSNKSGYNRRFNDQRQQGQTYGNRQGGYQDRQGGNQDRQFSSPKGKPEEQSEKEKAPVPEQQDQRPASSMSTNFSRGQEHLNRHQTTALNDHRQPLHNQGRPFYPPQRFGYQQQPDQMPMMPQVPQPVYYPPVQQPTPFYSYNQMVPEMGYDGFAGVPQQQATYYQPPPAQQVYGMPPPQQNVPQMPPFQ